MTDAVIRQAGTADLTAIAGLRRAQAAELSGEHGDAGFEQRFAAWSEREAARRITWLAEVDGRLAGMMNLAIFERMPRPGRPSERSVPFYQRAGFGPADSLLLWTP